MNYFSFYIPKSKQIWKSHIVKHIEKLNLLKSYIFPHFFFLISVKTPCTDQSIAVNPDHHLLNLKLSHTKKLVVSSFPPFEGKRAPRHAHYPHDFVQDLLVLDRLLYRFEDFTQAGIEWVLIEIFSFFYKVLAIFRRAYSMKLH